MLSRNILLISSNAIKNLYFSRYHLKLRDVNNMFIIRSQLKIALRKYCNTNSSATPEEQFKELSIANLTDFKTKNCPGLKYITPTLQKLLNISSIEVKNLFRRCSKLKTSTNIILERNYNICKEAGITNNILLQYPVILTLDNLKTKIEYLQELDVDINLLTPLVIANISTLRRIVEYAKVEEKRVPYKNRIVYLSKLLNLPAPEICEKIIYHSYVLRMPIDRLENILKVLLKYGVEPRNILNDCWALRYNPQIAEERLQRAIEANVIKVKTWMIRCQDKVFDRCITRQIENRTILGNHSSVEEYLSKRLECSTENAKYLTEKYPAIGKMNILKMKETLDFLYEQGYSPFHICRVPRILVHSQETTKHRIQQLKQLGYVTPSLAILCKSKRDFDKTLKRYAKRKKNKENESSNEE